MRHPALAVMLVSSLVPMAAHAAPTPSPCDLLDREMLAALHLEDADIKIEHKAVAATAHAPANRLDMCTYTPRVGSMSTLSLMRIPLARELPPGKPACSESTESKLGIANCNVVTKVGIVTVSLVSRRAGFETLSAAFRSNVERLFTPDNAGR